MTDKQDYQIMPLMSPEDFATLKEDIRHKGVIDPITYDENNNIIDGHHRFRAFVELVQEGADVPMFDKVVRRFESEEAKVDYILSLNVKRRHLNAQQRADLVVTLRRRGYTMARIAELLNVSEKTVSVDISLLPPETREELMSVRRVAADGRVFTSNYAPRNFQTGHQILRAVQQQAVERIGAQLLTNHPVHTDNATDLVPTETGTATINGVPYTPGTELRDMHTVPDQDAKPRMYKAFSWWGGKFSHLDWLLPLLPRCQHFVDVFGGSGSVILNRAPSPIETYNDIDDYVVTFFRVLRDNHEELIRQILLTPFSREERRIAYRGRQVPTDITDLEKARRFFVLAGQAHRAQAQDYSGHYLNAWRISRDKLTRGMAHGIADWEVTIDGLAYLATRLKRVQIENYPWQRVIELCDTPSTLLYCDPPYVHSTRDQAALDSYAGEMGDAEHRELAAKLHTIKGLAAVSGYPSELYNELYGDWHRFDMPVLSHASQYAAERVESVWTNYPL